MSKINLRLILAIKKGPFNNCPDQRGINN